MSKKNVRFMRDTYQEFTGSFLLNKQCLFSGFSVRGDEFFNFSHQLKTSNRMRH